MFSKLTLTGGGLEFDCTANGKRYHFRELALVRIEDAPP